MSQDLPVSVRLEPADEYMHANSGEPNFNESMYFNFFDPAERTGGFVRIACDDGEELAVEGRVLSLIPLRNRRDGRVTRISEGMTESTCGGRTGYGLSEYLDQQD